MRKISIKILATALCLLVLVPLAACRPKVDLSELWQNAIYREDTSFGQGEKTVLVKVVTPEKSITFTIKTDKSTLGEALIEHNLIEGEQGAFGIYVKKVNGILADYDVNASYWAFKKDGQLLMTGADSTPIADGDCFNIEYTK